MTARSLYFVGARLLGIYLIIEGLISALGLAETYEAALNSKAADPLTYAFVAGGQSLLLLVAGSILFLRHPLPNDSSESTSRPEEFLRVGIQLMGVYFLVAGAIGILHRIGEIVAVTASWTLQLTNIATSFAFVCVGLLLLFRASSIVRFVQTAA